MVNDNLMDNRAFRILIMFGLVVMWFLYSDYIYEIIAPNINSTLKGIITVTVGVIGLLFGVYWD